MANQLFKIEGKKMKKVLLATTALVMTTGYAAAEVSFSGKASAGIYSSTTNVAAVEAVHLTEPLLREKLPGTLAHVAVVAVPRAPPHPAVLLVDRAGARLYTAVQS